VTRARVAAVLMFGCGCAYEPPFTQQEMLRPAQTWLTAHGKTGTISCAPHDFAWRCDVISDNVEYPLICGHHGCYLERLKVAK